MFIDIRPALVGVTAVAELLGILRFDHIACQAAVGGVTGITGDLAFNDRMMRPFSGGNFDVAMAAETDLRLVGFLSAADMQVMTGIAGDIVAVMNSILPQIHARFLAVAGKAFRRFCLGIDIFIKGEDVYTSASAFFDMACAGSVTGFTGIL